MIAPQRGQAVGPVVWGRTRRCRPAGGSGPGGARRRPPRVPVHRAADGDRPRPTPAARASAWPNARRWSNLSSSRASRHAGGSGTACDPWRRGRWPGGGRRRRADPHVRPGRRDRQALDPVPDRRLDGAPRWVLVGEASASATTAVARLVVGRIDEASVGDGLEGPVDGVDVGSPGCIHGGRYLPSPGVVSTPGGGTPGLIHPVPAGHVTGWTGPRVRGEPWTHSICSSPTTTASRGLFARFRGRPRGRGHDHHGRGWQARSSTSSRCTPRSRRRSSTRRVHDATSELGETVDEGIQEHHVVKVLMAELGQVEAAADEWVAKMMVLIENVEHHAEEEEKEMFPSVRSTLRRRRPRGSSRPISRPQGRSWAPRCSTTRSTSRRMSC